MQKHSEEPIDIKTTPSDVCALVAEVSRAADSDKEALGFLPQTVFVEAAEQGKLWVAVAGSHYAGHMLFTRRFPVIQIFQVFVLPQFRRRGVGRIMLNQLVHDAESQSYLIVNAKVADDLEANRFWEAQGFFVVRPIPGGTARNRKILLRERRLNTPSLFDLLEASASPKDHELRLIDRLQDRIPVYVLDVNVLLDLLKNRERGDDVRRIMSAAMAGTISLYAAPELVIELSKSADNRDADPVLQFAATLPQFPIPPESQKNQLFLELAAIVFPAKLREGRLKTRDEGDINHLLSAIHNRATGFVTSEKAILRAHHLIWERFKLEVVGPSELSLGLNPPEWDSDQQIKASRSSGAEIAIVALPEDERAEVERFLISSGLEHDTTNIILAPGYPASPRRRFVIKVSGRIRAFAAWDAPQTITSTLDAFVTTIDADEDVEPALQSTLLFLMRDSCKNGARVIRILALPSNPVLRRLATSLGFRTMLAIRHSTGECLQKVCLGKVALDDNWAGLRQELINRAKIELPCVPPAYDGPETTVHVVSPQGATLRLPLHELEELIGPSLLLLKGRPGAVVPIQKRYADELFGFSPQSGFFPKYEASLHSRRAYISSVGALSATRPGTVLLFYESKRGGGQGEIIACARSVENAISPTRELPPAIKACGVLEDKAIETVGAKGRAGLTLFDTIFKFSKPISFDRLRKLGCVDGAQFVTSRKISYDRLRQILREGAPDVS